MDCDLEEPFLHDDGKKRQRFNTLVSNVSMGQDSLETIDGCPTHLKQISTATRGQAGWQL